MPDYIVRIDLPFTLSVEVYPANMSRKLVEANIIEAFKTSAVNVLNPVVRYQELLLPPHKNIVALSKIAIAEVGALGLLRQRSPCRKAGPVLHVYLIIGTPFRMPSLKSVFCANYFSFEVGGECRMFVSEALDA